MLQERIELSTSPLPRECSTTELLQRRGGRLDNERPLCKGDLVNFWQFLRDRRPVRLRVGQARRARRPQFAQAPCALLPASDCRARNAA